MKECCERKKKRSEEEKKALISRLNRMEGQIRGIKKMIEEDAYCSDILTQCLAIQSAFRGFNQMVLKNHMQSCVKTDLMNGEEDSYNEALELMRKLMK